MSEGNLFIGTFEKTDDLIIRQAENGGFIVLSRSGDPRVEPKPIKPIGAFTTVNDMILALSHSLAGSTDLKG